MDYAEKVASQMKKGLSNERSKIGEISRVLRDLGLSNVEVNYHMNVDEDFIPDVLSYYKSEEQAGRDKKAKYKNMWRKAAAKEGMRLRPERRPKMDFQELNKKMNNSEYQCNEAEVTLKEHGGDKAKNLYGIADAIDNQIKNLNHELNTINMGEVIHKLKGYADQLRLIADELERERWAERERERRDKGN